MADKELLELAAKAYGIKNSQYWSSRERPENKGKPDNFPFAQCIIFYTEDEPCPQTFKPLSDLNDTMRLAIKLRIEIFYSGKRVYARIQLKDIPSIYAAEILVGDEFHDTDAICRAVVRAAAEIGQGMQ